MVDPYLLTAPILLLAIVILLRFVGCSFQPGYGGVNITLTAQACNGKVTLSWIDSSGDTGSNYQIYRDGNLMYTVMQMTSYLDTAVTNGTTYSYTVSGSYGGSVYGTSNSASATPGNFPCRPSGAILDPNNPLAQNLIGLFLMNDAQGQPDGSNAQDTNIVDGTPATAGTNPNPGSPNVPPTWVLSDPSIWFHGGPSLTSFLDAGVDAAFDNMPTSKITIVAKVLLDAGAGGICEKNDGEQGEKDSGFRFDVTSNGALRFIVELSTTNMVIQSGDNAVPVQVQPWVQVAFTWDGTQSTTQNPGPASAAGLYVNGALQPNASETDGVGNLDVSKASNTNPFRIGNADYGPAAGSFYGKMAYMAIYKGRLLNTSDMMALDAQLPLTMS
jgi:Concanavalin A-like lectin/glucanases superfamily